MPRLVTEDTPITPEETRFNVSVIKEQAEAFGQNLTEEQVIDIAGGQDPELRKIVKEQIEADKKKAAAAFPIDSKVAFGLGGLALIGMVGGLAYYALKKDK